MAAVLSSPLALTMGDPAGIGGELTVRAWQALRHDGPCFVALDDPQRFTDVPIVEVASLSSGARFIRECIASSACQTRFGPTTWPA